MTGIATTDRLAEGENARPKDHMKNLRQTTDPQQQNQADTMPMAWEFLSRYDAGLVVKRLGWSNRV